MTKTHDSVVLKKIETWPYENREEIFEYIVDNWFYPEYVQETKYFYIFGIGGFIHNEMIIAAFRRNSIIWNKYFHSQEEDTRFRFYKSEDLRNKFKSRKFYKLCFIDLVGTCYFANTDAQNVHFDSLSSENLSASLATIPESTEEYDIIKLYIPQINIADEVYELSAPKINELDIAWGYMELNRQIQGNQPGSKSGITALLPNMTYLEIMNWGFHHHIAVYESVLHSF